MARIRANYVFGDTDVAISNTDTTLSSPALARLPAVTTPDIAAVTLHDREAGTYEIVHVTAHTASATTATILRGRESTSAVAWDNETTWVHGITVADAAEFTNLPLTEVLATASVSGSYSVNASTASFHHLTLTGATTLTLTGAAATGITSVSVQVTQDATGGRDVTWPAVTWLPGGAPVEQAGATKSTLALFWTTDAGVTWFGTYGAENPLAVGDTAWRLVGAVGEPAFQNSWVVYGDPYAKAAFRKDAAGVVHLRGLIKSGTVGQTVFNLPVGYRPAGPEGTLLIATISNGAIGRVDIISDPAPVSGGIAGDVKVTTGNTAWAALDNITFVAGA